MGKERVAVVGVGQTHHQATPGDVSIAGLVREAAVEALADAGMTWATSMPSWSARRRTSSRA